MNRLDPWKLDKGDDSSLVNLLMRRVLQIVDQNRDFLLRAPSNLTQDLVTVKSVADFMRAYCEDSNSERDARVRSLLWDVLEGDSGSTESKRVTDAMKILETVYGQRKTFWNLKKFQTARDALEGVEAYRQLKIKDSLRPVLDFFEEDASSAWESETDRELCQKVAQKLRSYGAELLESGKAVQLLLLSGENPEEFARILKELSLYLNKSDLKGKELERFFQMIRRSLSVPGH
jgi:hypothetical protein